MDTGKNKLSPEIIEAIRNAVKEEIGKVIIKQHPFFGMLESEKVFMEEQEQLKEHPLKGVLGHTTNERGREFVYDIYKHQRFDRDDIQDLINWDEVWNKIVDANKS